MEEKQEHEFEVFEHDDVKKTWLAYYVYIQKNFKKLIMESTITVDQFDDLYAGYFGVFGNLGAGKTPERIDELSPMTEVKTENEREERTNSLQMSVVGVIMQTRPYTKMRDYLDGLSVDEYILQNAKTDDTELPSLTEIREMIVEKFEKEHGNKI